MVYCLLSFGLFIYPITYYRPQTKLRQSNVFTPVCQSFYSQGGVWQTPPGQTPSPGSHPQADTPGQTLPWQTPPNGHCSVQYASNWQCFLVYWVIFSVFAGKKCIELNQNLFSLLKGDCNVQTWLKISNPPPPPHAHQMSSRKGVGVK